VNNQTYSYQKLHSTRYTFTSWGINGEILKAVEFNIFPADNIFILSFGDIKKDGSIDDLVMSNNNDIPKIIATVVVIVKEFMAENRDATIFFTGSSPIRTSLYRRVLKHTMTALARNLLLQL
jgi:hypothetical protein